MHPFPLASRNCSRSYPWWIIPLFTLTSLNFSCRPGEPPPNERQGVPGYVVPGSFQLSLSPSLEAPTDLETLRSTLAKVAKEKDCTVESLDPIAWEPGAISAELAESYHLRLGSCQETPEQVARTLEALSQIPSLTRVEAEARVKIAVAENDPYKPRQYYLSKIRRDEACSQGDRAQAKPVLVAVIDSGVASSHPDLKDAFYRDAAGEIVGANFVGKGATQRPDRNWEDRNGHGTHVAGLIAATHQNRLGIAGVAACADVRILPVRVMDENGQGSSIEIERGVQWAAAQGADIINLSLGSNTRFAKPYSSHPSSLYNELAQRKIIVFAAAGNDGITLGEGLRGGYSYTFPASYDNVISVAASDEYDRLASFSNRGATVDIAAPGARDLSTYLNGSYQALNGTSMASPVAAGAYAMALSFTRRSTQDRFAYEEIRPLLAQAVRTANLGSDVQSGGILDAVRLLEGLREKGGRSPSQIGSPSPAPSIPTQPVETDFQFVGLTKGQNLRSATRLAVTGWPQGKTAEIYLYWVTSEDPGPQAFTRLDRRNLDTTGRLAISEKAYYLYGEGSLVAEAVDLEGQSLKTIVLPLRGR